MHDDVVMGEEEDQSFVRGQNDREMLKVAGALATYFGKVHLEAGTILDHACAQRKASVGSMYAALSSLRNNVARVRAAYYRCQEAWPASATVSRC
jgi:hypothetical protein